jgi:hypothetical protein
MVCQILRLDPSFQKCPNHNLVGLKKTTTTPCLHIVRESVPTPPMAEVRDTTWRPLTACTRRNTRAEIRARAKVRSRLTSVLFVPVPQRISPGRQRIGAKLIRASPEIRIAHRSIVRLAVAILAPAQRPAGVPALVCLCGVQERVFVFFLVATALGVAVVVVRFVGFDFGGPGVVFAVVAAGVVRVLLLGVVGEDAFANELVHVVSGDSGAQGKEDAEYLISLKALKKGWDDAYKIMTPTPTAPLLMLHIVSLPYLKVVQLRSSAPIFFSSAPSLMPVEFHIATAMKAANQRTMLGQL